MVLAREQREGCSSFESRIPILAFKAIGVSTYIELNYSSNGESRVLGNVNKEYQGWIKHRQIKQFLAIVSLHVIWANPTERYHHR